MLLHASDLSAGSIKSVFSVFSQPVGAHCCFFFPRVAFSRFFSSSLHPTFAPFLPPVGIPLPAPPAFPKLLLARARVPVDELADRSDLHEVRGDDEPTGGERRRRAAGGRCL
jgi:hypothetical protein